VKSKGEKSRKEIVQDLTLVLTILFTTDFLMVDFFPQLYLYTILLWAALPLLVELVLRKGTIRNLGFLKTNFKKSLSLYIALVAAWVLITFGLLESMSAHSQSSLLVEYSLYFATFFFHPAFVEELNFRGYLQTRLERLFSVRRSIMLQAIVFAAYHIPAALPMSKLGFSPGGFLYPVFALALGVVNGIVYFKTRNLFVGMAIHGSLLATFELLTLLLMH
jgi:membrane protease YdiL (CAAX protease family)